MCGALSSVAADAPSPGSGGTLRPGPSCLLRHQLPPSPGTAAVSLSLRPAALRPSMCRSRASRPAAAGRLERLFTGVGPRPPSAPSGGRVSPRSRSQSRPSRRPDRAPDTLAMKVAAPRPWWPLHRQQVRLLPASAASARRRRRGQSVARRSSTGPHGPPPPPPPPPVSRQRPRSENSHVLRVRGGD